MKNRFVNTTDEETLKDASTSASVNPNPIISSSVGSECVALW